jgi:hypothetical protein
MTLHAAPRAVFSVLSLLSVASVSACGRKPPAPAVELAPVELVDAGVVEDVAEYSALDLLPGSVRAFGLVMPMGTTEHLSDNTMKMFYVSAPMMRVMRYLQRRLVITNGDIRPLGALIRHAQVRFIDPALGQFVDVGVRDEGDRTFVTVWNRPTAGRPDRPITAEQSMRLAGFDPDSGRPLERNNH